LQTGDKNVAISCDLRFDNSFAGSDSPCSAAADSPPRPRVSKMQNHAPMKGGMNLRAGSILGAAADRRANGCRGFSRPRRKPSDDLDQYVINA
jgi:hypothetical protein